MRPPPGVYIEGSTTAVASGEFMTTRLCTRGSRRYGSGDQCRQLLAAEAALHATTAALCTVSWDNCRYHGAWIHHVLVLSERVQSDGSGEALARASLDGRRWMRIPSHMLQGVKRAARSVGLFRDHIATRFSGTKLGACTLTLGQEQEQDAALMDDNDGRDDNKGSAAVVHQRTSAWLTPEAVEAMRLSACSKSVPVRPADVPDFIDKPVTASVMQSMTANFAASAATTVNLLDIDDLDTDDTIEDGAEDRSCPLLKVRAPTASHIPSMGCAVTVGAVTASPTWAASSLPRSSFSFAPLPAFHTEERSRARPASDDRASGWMARSLMTEISWVYGPCSGITDVAVTAPGSAQRRAEADAAAPAAIAVAPEAMDGSPEWRHTCTSSGQGRPVTPLSLQETAECPRAVDAGAAGCSMAGGGAASSSSPSWVPSMFQWRGPVHEVELLTADCCAEGGDERIKMRHRGNVRLESMEVEAHVHMELSPTI